MSENGAQQTLVRMTREKRDRDELLHWDIRAERRRIQNRVNQRAYRKRKAQKNHGPTPPKRWKVIGTLGGGDEQEFRSESDTAPDVHKSAQSFYLFNNSSQTKEHEGEIHCRLAPPCERRRAYQFALTVRRDYVQGTPQVDHLLTLVKLNVYNAFAENMNALGMDVKGWMHPDAVSPFCTFEPKAFNRLVPNYLQPTAIQRAVPHHPWLDFFPHPRMRDRLIFAGNNYDDEQLCIDIMGFWNPDENDPALLVWGPPWDIANWEMSEAFVRKWGWTVQDCPELFRSTNRWRAQRGEKLLLFR
ncbi:hypothetical protein BO85DRAFT_524949 [Aspergillus piperis CBS 112811]|uniref:BZIP domain-containing protein n=1 Tax=Aspergillus piperis CBS 112811 TaxID=1448313 RepID=A0A8G1QRV6_9EURO|nr:hypothetical protein BO85DRAFT_524949 [Aspergillus piperis CBS 112811]RAH51702.1 hypothetical protein BO85DRAFT_524949 [Aspergillus piperis CBS 112811]